MMPTPSPIQQTVMRRVRVVHAVRPFTGAAAGAFVLFGASLYLIGREVFVAQVFRNMPRLSDYADLWRFFEAAFLNTTFIVQALTVLAALAAFWLTRECVRLLVPAQRYA